MGEIMRLVGKYEGLEQPAPAPMLRRENQIRTVVGSVAIEGNTLTIEQVTTMLEGRRIAGSQREIREVTNAIAAYERAAELDPGKERDLLRAHRLLVDGLVADAGRFRGGGVGVVRGSELPMMAPPAKRVPALVAQLLEFVRRDRTPMLVKSAVAHYELELIHPFSDGNGRVGRLWQHVMLQRVHPVFELVPVESVLHARQAAYYRVLAACDAAGDSSQFIELSLAAIRDSLHELVDALRPAPMTSEQRLELAHRAFGSSTFSRKDYLALFKRISTATASRDLRDCVDAKALQRTGERALARYRFR
jgi:Fic family protein